MALLFALPLSARPPKVDHVAEGERCYNEYRFAEAKEHYQAYMEQAKVGDERLPEVEELLHRTEVALRYLNRVEDVAIIDSVSFPRNELMSHLPKLSPDMGTISMEGLTYACTNERGDRRYTAVRTDDGLRTLLCKQERLLDGWSEPDTLPVLINRYAHQAYPLLMPDGLTLYYAAYSSEGLGDWDIYVTKYNPANDTYLTPEALGMPYNSTSNDLFFLLDESAGRGWFASDRQSALGQLTLYTFLPGEKRLLRDSSEQYVRDYAMLRVLRQPAPAEEVQEAEPLLPSLRPEVQEAEHDSIHLSIGNRLYTRLADFRNDNARQKAADYLHLQEEMAEQQTELLRLREAYHRTSSADERERLRPLILSLEQDLPGLQRQAAALLTELRQLEY